VPKANPQEPNAYAFARIVNGKYKLGSDRRALTFWLASMSVDTMERWGRSELRDADILKLADKMGCPAPACGSPSGR
jgi:hypothetical protein